MPYGSWCVQQSPEYPESVKYIEKDICTTSKIELVIMTSGLLFKSPICSALHSCMHCKKGIKGYVF